jgi:alkylglycerol monooxygenase
VSGAQGRIMYPDIIAIATPFFAATVVLEYLHDRKQPVQQYRLNRSLSNIACGIAEQSTSFLSKGAFLVLYASLFEHCRLHTFSNLSWLTWTVLLPLVDLTFYFFHRAAHASSLLWAVHVAHHEHCEYNLTVALRRSVLQDWFILPLYLPFAIGGFSTEAFMLAYAIQNLYQFLLHTPYAPKLPLVDQVLNTPRDHMVHHCRNPRYLDKNFGGIFVVWDKLFGTFEPLSEPPRFGVLQPTTTLNPIVAQFTTLARVMKHAMTGRGLVDKLRLLWVSPSHLADSDSGETAQPPCDRPLSTSAASCAVALFATALAVNIVYQALQVELTPTYRFVALFLVGTILYAIGLLLDGFAPRLLMGPASRTASEEAARGQIRDR